MPSTVESECVALMNEIRRLSKERRFGEALKRVDRFMNHRRSSPEMPDLKRSLTAHRASLLCLAGSFRESLSAWDERARLGFLCSADAYELALGRGTCYLKMGKPEEAARILEVTLDRSDPSHLAPIQSLLERLKEAYAAMRKPVPERWRGVAARVNVSLSEDAPTPRRSRVSLTALVGKRPPKPR